MQIERHSSKKALILKINQIIMPFFMYDNPKVKSLIKDFFSLPNIFDFLKSSNFDRVVLEYNFSQKWEGEKNLMSIKISTGSNEFVKYPFERLIFDANSNRHD